jgi:hypothetical protein
MIELRMVGDTLRFGPHICEWKAEPWICVKCGFTGIHPRFCQGVTTLEGINPDAICMGVEHEHLYMLCVRCGWVWLMETQEIGIRRQRERPEALNLYPHLMDYAR